MAKHSQGESTIEKIKRNIKEGFFTPDFYSAMPGLVLLLDDCNNNQLYYYACMKSGAFLQNNGNVEISIYTISNQRPMFFPPTALYSINELHHLDDGYMIATSLNTASFLLNTKYKDKFFYLHNINELYGLHKEQLEAIKQNGFKFICRNDDHRNILKQYFQINCVSPNVPDLNIDKLLQAVGVVL